MVVLAGLVVAFQRPALSEAAAFTAEVVCARQGLEFHAESVTAGLFALPFSVTVHRLR